MRPLLRWLAVAPLAAVLAACGGAAGPKPTSAFHPSDTTKIKYMDALQPTHLPLGRTDRTKKAVAVGKDVCALISRSDYTHTFRTVDARYHRSAPQFDVKDAYGLIEASVNNLCPEYKDKLPPDGANPFPTPRSTA